MNTAVKYDILEAYHNDYDRSKYDEDFYQEDELLKSVDAINLGDIMGEDHDVWLSKNSRFGFNLEIDNEDAQTILKEEGIHPYAIDSLATFCRRFLNIYSKVLDKEQA